MKTASPAFLSLLASRRFYSADLYEFSLTGGTSLFYGEARGEGKQGTIAVACVIVTRAMIAAEYVDLKGEPHPLYGDRSLASAYQAPLQFSRWNADDPNRGTIEASHRE
jgi:hypothetical protein